MMEQYVDPSTIVPPTSLDDLVKQLTEIFSHDKVNVEYVQTLMTSYKSKPKDWKKYAIFDQHRYTRNLVDEGNGKFNLIVLCWGEGMGSSIHSHAGAHCFMKVLDGSLSETMFEWPDESNTEIEESGMVERNSNDYKLNQCAYICDDLGLHRVENKSHSDRAVSLHLYSPPFDLCQTFDQRTGKQHDAKVTFWSRYGERTPFRPSGACAAIDQTEVENN